MRDTVDPRQRAVSPRAPVHGTARLEPRKTNIANALKTVFPRRTTGSWGGPAPRSATRELSHPRSPLNRITVPTAVCTYRTCGTVEKFWNSMYETRMENRAKRTRVFHSKGAFSLP